MINSGSKINFSKIGWEGGGSISIWIMSLNLLCVFYVNLMDVSRVFANYFKGISSEFQGCFKEGSRKFLGCFKGALNGPCHQN